MTTLHTTVKETVDVSLGQQLVKNWVKELRAYKQTRLLSYRRSRRRDHATNFFDGTQTLAH